MSFTEDFKEINKQLEEVSRKLENSSKTLKRIIIELVVGFVVIALVVIFL